MSAPKKKKVVSKQGKKKVVSKQVQLQTELKINVRVLKQTVNKKPMYVGHAVISALHEVSKAPSYNVEDKNSKIAGNVVSVISNSSKTIKEWQRPPVQKSISAIKKAYESNSEIMANPILLAVHPENKDLITLTQSPTEAELYFLQVYLYKNSIDKKPLLIIDGQHRLAGLNKVNKYKDNYIPFVLLFDENSSVYRASELAKIFAQVSTSATPLNKVHKLWLEYTFQLGEMVEEKTKNRASFESVAYLAQGDQWITEDRIEFCPEYHKTIISEANSEDYGPIFSGDQLYRIIKENFFDQIEETVSLTGLSLKVATLINEFLKLLKFTNNNHKNNLHKSPIFSKDNSQYPIIYGLLCSFLRYLSSKFDIVTTVGGKQKSTNYYGYELYDNNNSEFTIPDWDNVHARLVNVDWSTIDGSSLTLRGDDDQTLMKKLFTDMFNNPTEYSTNIAEHVLGKKYSFKLSNKSLSKEIEIINGFSKDLEEGTYELIDNSKSKNILKISKKVDEGLIVLDEFTLRDGAKVTFEVTCYGDLIYTHVLNVVTSD